MRRFVPCLVLALALKAGRLDAATATLVPSADTSLFEENGDASNAKGPGLFAGRNSLTFTRRALLKFDLTAIPAGSTVTGARLELDLTRAKGNPVDVFLFRVTAPWGEGTSNSPDPGGTGAAATPGDATWTKRIWPGTDWTTPGGDTVGSPSARSPIATVLGTYAFGPTDEMVSDVQSWLDSPATNYGWQIAADELQAPPSARRFGSRESVDPAEQPKLTVTFDPPGGSGRPANDVPALSFVALLGLAAALAALGAGSLRKG
ncbi:MAG TPA: DNRLRE domain-containing protein [Thermoanaerobaculia bacterium]|nr:DNRLRE domain-containing protein [Thermoanaerobaculia bacterium]